MDPPSIRHTVRDEVNNVTYHVMAHLQLTKKEVMQGVSLYLSQPQQRRRKKPVRDKVITILSLIGCDGR